ncbi:MAG: hypothetical protein J0H52_11675, partial [Comamonadaceae bacterium]|nr:hypothetical protein [Comamonadaceae bacterium]
MSEQPTAAHNAPAAAPAQGGGHFALALATMLALAGLASSALLWQKLNHIQEQLARQSADTGAHATEARTLARQAEELARETAARLTVAETRVSEVALQR